MITFWKINHHTLWYYFPSNAFKIRFDFTYSFSTQLILLKHGAQQMIGSQRMFEDNLNESVIEMNEQYGTTPSFWNGKLGSHRPFFFPCPPTRRNKLLIGLLENRDHSRD